MHNPSSAPVALTMLALIACGGGATETESQSERSSVEAPASSANEAVPASGGRVPHPDVTGEEARVLLANGAFLLDVTGPRHAEESELEGRVNIPLPDLESRMSEIPRDRTVVVYCFGGGGSARATQILRDAGYTDVRLLGPIENWGGGASE